MTARFSGTAAATERVAGHDATWRDLLFGADGRPRDPSEPSQALLATADTLVDGLRAHFATLPERARLHWLDETLGIARLPVVPDEVVVVATSDPAPVPPVLARGTELRAAKAGTVPERTYVTTDSLTVLGATLAGVCGYLAEGGDDVAARRVTDDAPFAPFEGDPAIHRMDLVTDEIAFKGGNATVTLRFAGADVRALAGATWCYSRKDGLGTATPVATARDTLTMTLVGSCEPYEGDGDPRTFLRVTFPGDEGSAARYAFSFTGVDVSMTRSGVRADAAYYNDGTLDVSKEFQPFGPVPRQGDALYVRSDEAFAKRLSSLEISLERPGTTGFVRPNARVVTGWSTPELRLSWQHRTATRWTEFDAVGALRGPDPVDLSGGPVSVETEVSGTPGRYVRLVLAEGDFGWETYLARVARFAAEAASSGTPSAADLAQPVPPSLTGISITHTTKAAPVTDVRTLNAFAVGALPTTGVRRPFFQPVRDAGTVTFGFVVAAQHLGSVLSWYAHVEQAPACESAGQEHVAHWEYWNGAWVSVDTLDGTRGLRQSGLVRLVTPLDWREGCADTGADTGRWLRLRTTTPGFVGALLDVQVDAVTARWAGGAGDPLVPLVREQVKGLRTPVAGVKVTNPVAGTPGRAAEGDEGYRRRAGAVVRHRNRGIQAWDYETLVTSEFPEVAVARCLPHTDADGCSAPGCVGLVVLPRSAERMPYPSVALAERIADSLRPRVPVHANVVVLCPEYVPIRFRAEIVLRRGVASAEARVRILEAVERELHPLSGEEGAPFGRALYPSSLVAFLERLGDVDHVTSFALLAPHTTGDVVAVDPCRGLIASGGDHQLALRETL